MRIDKPAAALACALAVSHACGEAAHARQQGPQPGPAAAGQTRPQGVNTAPFILLAERGRKLVEEGRLGAATTLDMSAKAELREDGTLDPVSVVVEWRTVSADEGVNALALQLVAAVSESRIPGALRGHAKAVRLDVRLGAQNFTFGVEAELASEAEASKCASGYDALLAVARQAKRGTPDGALYEAMKVTSEGRAFGVTFEMPKAAAAKMVADALDRRAAGGAASPRQD